MKKEEQEPHSLQVLLEFGHQAVEALCQAANWPEQSELVRRFLPNPMQKAGKR
jgi:hypothetical protein